MYRSDSFISNIEHSETDRKLVSAMIAMSHAMSLEVVAEGVENIEQLRSKELTQWLSKPLDHALLTME